MCDDRHGRITPGTAPGKTDLAKWAVRTVAVQSPVIPLVGKATPLDLELRLPRKATTFLVCLRIDGCMKGKVNETPSTKGMRMEQAGVV
jgi:hypothetical protein